MGISIIKRLLVATCLLSSCISFAQLPGKSSDKPNWTVKEPFEQNVFVENNGGQFDSRSDNKNEKIYFSTSITGVNIYFSTKGAIYRHDEVITKGREPESAKGEQEKENATVIPHFFSALWKGASENVIIIPEDEVTAYYTYSVNGHAIIAHAYKKILYKNIYNGIDIEYSFPEDKKGLEYSVIIHPGAELSQVKLSYANANEIKQNGHGDIEIKSSFGQFVDHAPVKTFYKEDNGEIKSSATLRGNEVSFNAGNYNSAKTLVIDPWVSNPAYAGYNNAYDVDYDFNGNVYVYGGLPPYQLQKYNGSGILLWSYTTALGGYDSSANSLWAGDFTADHRNGDAYIVNGLGGNATGPYAIKINTSGVEVALTNSIGAELWKVKFDYCNNQLIIGAGLQQGGESAIMDTSLAKFKYVNVLGSSDCCHDMCLLALDQSGSAYFATDSSVFGASGFNNKMLRASLPNLLPVSYIVRDGYSFAELLTPAYYPYQQNGATGYGNGFNGMAADKKILVTYDGATLKKWAPSTGILLNSITITGNPMKWGGLDIDCANNIYLGNNSNVDIYDSSFSFLSSISLPDTIFDIKLGNNHIYACGAGFVSSNPYPYAVDSTYIVFKRTLPTSCSACNGTATAYIRGCGVDSAAYSYQWSNGQTTSTATGLCYGTYTVTIKENCELQFTDTVNLPGGGGLTMSITQTNVSCASTNDGAASVTISGGTAPYTYSWSPTGGTTSSVSGLAAGTYSLVVNDNAGNCISGTVVIQPPPVIGVDVVSINSEICKGSNDGSAVVSAFGGTPPYIYSWSPSGGTSSSANNLTTGTFTVIVTDSNGCSGMDTVTIQANAFSIKVNTTNVACTGGNNGSATVIVSGSNLYIITWSYTGSGGSSVSNLPPGSYYVNVRDSNTGCSITDSFKITKVTPFSLITAQVNDSCYGQANGSASVTPDTSGMFTYLWSTGSTNTAISDLTAGTYWATVTDSDGCKDSASFTIMQPSQLFPYITSVSSGCKDSSNGSATANAIGGTPPYTYNWAPSGNTNTAINNLSPGNYSVTITDAKGCSVSSSVTISAQSDTFAITGADSVCVGNSTMLTVAGGTAYNWSNGSTISSISVLPSTTTTYSVVVTDSLGCADTLSEIVKVNLYPIINICCDTTIHPGQSVQLSASGGGSYVWTPNNGLSCYTCAEPIASPSVTTNYIVTVTSNAGCSATDSVLVKVESCNNAWIPDAFTPNNKDGLNNFFAPKSVCITSYTMYIFDRWGSLIYQSSNVPWDGTAKGERVQEDTYVYKMQVTTNDGSYKTYVGRVTVLK
ncbi:MAG: T9SS type B sorting domain-containing protein [Bacteroidia bacterium]